MVWPEMRQSMVAFIAGIIFSAGLTISRMIDPAKVLGFLDVFGQWDASLALVMASALLVMAIAWRLAVQRNQPVFAENFPAPAKQNIDARLVGGAILFGVGWGLIGLCPGPAISGLALGRWEVVIFVIAMLVGMALHQFTASPKPRT